jgi:hypothetical protein
MAGKHPKPPKPPKPKKPKSPKERPEFRFGKYEEPAVLEYATLEREGARHLLVTWPKLVTGAAPPALGARRLVEGFRAHVLILGCDEHLFLGPERSFSGWTTSVRIVHDEAARLGVPREDVIAFGTSLAGGRGLRIGLSAGVGWVIVGGAPALMGQAAKRFHAAGDLPASVKQETVGNAVKALDSGDEDLADFLDRLGFEVLEGVSAPTRIDLFCSKHDYAYEGNRRFAEAAARNPLVDCTLHVAEYGPHALVKVDYPEFLREKLKERIELLEPERS